MYVVYSKNLSVLLGSGFGGVEIDDAWNSAFNLVKSVNGEVTDQMEQVSKEDA